MRILFTDDSSALCNMAKEALLDAGYSDVLLCDSGRAAIEILGRESVDLVVLDWHMPGLSGMDVLNFIRNQEKLKAIPVIMLTAEDHPRSIEAAIQNGANDYMVKPFDIDLFIQKVQRFAGK